MVIYKKGDIERGIENRYIKRMEMYLLPDALRVCLALLDEVNIWVSALRHKPFILCYLMF